MRKIAAFHWSVEHAVAAWDCGVCSQDSVTSHKKAESSVIAVFVTKWVHTIELDSLNDILTSLAVA